MVGEHQLAMHQIVGMDASGILPPGCKIEGEFPPGIGKASGPIEPVAVEFPGIGNVTRGFERSGQGARRLFVPCGHRHQPWLVTRPALREAPTRDTDRRDLRREYVEELLNVVRFGACDHPRQPSLSSVYARRETA